ncbi:BTAD domain-containing putative transcriptional regulator [Streptomyces sp. NPDC004732]|uniref:AfsR/SARP family transcriptional regulator n=1 Tax=Streptomyces sp. NPDC004732 TaxID=3154290 RepID=UPI0033BE2665
MRGDAGGRTGRDGERGADREDLGGPLWFQVLGPVRAWRDGQALTLGPPQQRATLAALLLRGGRPVSAAELVDALWDEAPPPRAIGTLRTYVSRLRTLLEPDRRAREPARLLVSAGDGYALRLPRGALDASELEDRVSAARSLRVAGEHADAYAELTAALALSDGSPLAGLPGPYARRQRDRLTELSVTAQEEFFACALELGCHGETTAPLSVFAAEHPLRERAQALLMLALHRGGRRADALAVYEATRRTLATELGVDPGKELAALHEGLLRGTPMPPAALPWPSPHTAPPRATGQRPHISARPPHDRNHDRTTAEAIRGTTPAQPTPEAAQIRTNPSELRPTAAHIGPGAAQPHPGTAYIGPGAVQPHLGAVQPHPAAAPIHPGATPIHPGAAQPHPGAPQPHPGAAPIPPGAAQPYPGTAQSYLGAVQPHPGAPQPHPASAPIPPSAAHLSPVPPHTHPVSPPPPNRTPPADLAARPLPLSGTAPVGGTGPSPVRGSVVPLTPAQLLPDVPDFAGREGEARVLTETLRSATSGSTMAVATLTGLGGVGKTALAVHVAHALRDEFPDGQLYVDLRGADPAPGVDSGSALTGFLRALGIPESAVPDGIDQQTALYRSLLAGRRMLVFLDNARDTAQVRPLLPGAPGCAVLVTSRSRTITLPGARLVDVETMDEPQALGLLCAIVGAERVAAERDAARELVAVCGGLPLAVRIVAARLAARPGRPMADLVARLRDERRRLDELRVDDLGVEATFRLGYEALEPGLAHAFRMVSLCYMPSFCRGAAGALLGVSEEEAEQAVERLVDAGLMELHGEDRYRFHDLVRLFARRQCELRESAQDRAAARLRFLDYVLATVVTAIRRTKPHSVLPELLHSPASAGKALPDEAAAHDWLVVAHSRLCDAAENALRHVPDEAADTDVPGVPDVPDPRCPPGLRPVVDLLTAWSHLVAGTARHRDLEPLAELALRTARRHGDDRSAARALRLLGAPHYGTETYGRAEHALRESLHLAAACGDLLVGAEGSHELGIVLMGTGRYAQALEQLRLAYARFGALGGHDDRIRILSHMARAYVALGRRPAADTAIDEAVRQARRSGSTHTLAHVLYQAGCALLGDGRAAAGAEQLREAQRLHGAARNPRWEALCWARLAYCELAQGSPGEAMRCADAALAVEGELGDAFCHALAMAARGRALLAVGDLERARAALRIAHRVMERRGALEADEIAGLLATLRPGAGVRGPVLSAYG